MVENPRLSPIGQALLDLTEEPVEPVPLPSRVPGLSPIGQTLLDLQGPAPAPTLVPEPPGRPSILGEFTTGVASGTRRLGAEALAVGGVTTAIFGAEETSQELLELAQAREEDIRARFPRTVEFAEAFDSPGNMARFVARLLGEQTPVIASIILGGGIGGLVGRAVGKRALSAAAGDAIVQKFVARGALGGVVGATTGIETGATALEQQEAIGGVEPGVALTAGIAKGILEAVVPFAFARRLGILPGQADDFISRIGAQLSRVGGRPARVAAGLTAGGTVEAATETLQEAVDVAARSFVDDNFDALGPGVGDRILEAAFSGGVVGLLLGGVGGAVAPSAPSRPEGPRFVPPPPPEGPPGVIIPEAPGPEPLGLPAPPLRLPSPVEPEAPPIELPGEVQEGDFSTEVFVSGAVSGTGFKFAGQTTPGGTTVTSFTPPNLAQFAVAHVGVANVKLLQVDKKGLSKDAVSADLASLPSVGELTRKNPRVRLLKRETAIEALRLAKEAVTLSDKTGVEPLVQGELRFLDALDKGFRFTPEEGDGFVVIGELPQTREIGVEELGADPEFLTSGRFLVKPQAGVPLVGDSQGRRLFNITSPSAPFIGREEESLFKVDVSKLPADQFTTSSALSFASAFPGGIIRKDLTQARLESIVRDSPTLSFAKGTRRVDKAKIAGLIADSAQLDPGGTRLHARELIRLGLRRRPGGAFTGGVFVGKELPRRALLRVPAEPVFGESRSIGFRAPPAQALVELTVPTRAKTLRGKAYDAASHRPGTTVVLVNVETVPTQKEKTLATGVARFYDTMLKRFGLNDQKLVVFLGSPGPTSHGSFSLSPTSGGFYVGFDDKVSNLITLNPKQLGDVGTRPGFLFDGVPHEFGHLISHRALLQADASVQRRLLSAYNRSLIKATEGTFTNFVFEFFSPLKAVATAESLQEEGRLPAREALRDESKDKEYWFNFEEWFANHVARWFQTQREPMGILEKFFNGIAQRLKTMFKAFHVFQGRSLEDFAPAVEVQRFLESLQSRDRLRVSPAIGSNEEASIRQNSEFVDGAVPHQAHGVYQDRLFKKLKIPQREREEIRALSDRFNWFMKVGWNLLQVARVNPGFARLQEYAEVIDRWYTTKMKWVSRSDQRVRELKALGTRQVEALSKMIFDVDSMSYLSVQEIKDDTSRLPTEEELAAIAKKHGVESEAFEIFQRIREDFTEVLDAIQTAAEKALAEQFPPGSAELEVEIAQLNADMRQMRLRPYFPHSRFGDFSVTVKEGRGEEVRTVYMQQFPSRKAARKAALTLRREFPEAAGFSVGVDKIPKTVQVFRGLPPTLLKAMKAKLGLSEEQRAWFDRLIVEFSPAKSFRKRFLRRKDIPGFSLNAMRGYADYFFHGAGYIARVQWGGDLESIISDARKETSELRLTMGREGVADVSKREEIIEFMRDHLSHIMDPKPDWAQLRSVAFQWHLGYVPVSAVLNLTQVPMVTWPYLAARFGDGRAIGAIRRATFDFKKAFEKGSPDASDALLRGLNLGMEQGFLDESFAKELAATASGSNLARLLPGSKLERMLMQSAHWSAFMFQTSEKFNRSVTFRAAWNLALENPGAEYLTELRDTNTLQFRELVGQGWSELEATAFLAGKDAVQRTQFQYSQHARPRFMRGRAGTVLTFFMFVQHMLWFSTHSPGKGRYLLMMFFMAGLMGLPGAEDLAGIAKFMGRSFFGADFDVERETREFVLALVDGEDLPPDMILHGISRVGFGIPAVMDMVGVPFPMFDMSANIGLGQVVPGLAQIGDQGDFEQKFARITTRAAGAVFGTGINVLRALTDNELPVDDFKRMERAFPRSLKNVMKASRFFQEERERTRTGATVIEFDASDPEDLAEIVAQGLGFTPTRLGRKWDRQRAQAEVIAFWRIRKGMLMRQYDHAFAVRSGEGVKDVLADMKRFNNTTPFPSMRIRRSDLARSRKARNRARRLFELGLPTARREIPIARDVQRLFPEVEDIEDVSRKR
ncbi:MAG: PLxRFG domain-containing protein [Acidobacteriota bacterium]